MDRTAFKACGRRSVFVGDLARCIRSNRLAFISLAPDQAAGKSDLG
jgi:hypothetical protein